MIEQCDTYKKTYTRSNADQPDCDTQKYLSAVKKGMLTREKKEKWKEEEEWWEVQEERRRKEGEGKAQIVIELLGVRGV